jgi:hypothetical protein
VPSTSFALMFFADIARLQKAFMDVGLDTFDGCNVIRTNSLPSGAKICPFSNPSHVHAAQGKELEILGVASLFLMAGEEKVEESGNFLVVRVGRSGVSWSPLDKFQCVED